MAALQRLVFQPDPNLKSLDEVPCARARGSGRTEKKTQNAKPTPRFSELPSVKCSSVSGSLCWR